MVAPPYPVLAIAKWFVAWAEAEQEELSNLKLQKLLYYAQGHHLAEGRGPLFTESIEAWAHGPVAPRAYAMMGSFLWPAHAFAMSTMFCGLNLSSMNSTTTIR